MKILIIEDDENILTGLKDDLELEGYKVIAAMDGAEGLNLANTEKPNLIVLDLMLPKMNGYEVCKKIREKKSAVPIIMLTAKSQETDKVLGLELGADDYVTKPFSLRELLARIKTILRRTEDRGKKEISKYSFGDILVDFKKTEVFKGKREIKLSVLEFNLLKYLILRKDEVVTRNQLLDDVWGYDKFPSTRTIDNHILMLRKKIEKDVRNPKYLLTVHKIGYKFIG